MNRQRLLLLVALWVLALPWSAPANGLLIPKDQGLPPLAVKSLRLSVQLADQVARTQVEQVFINHTGRQLEAVYVFPLPAGASVTEFAMMMNGKRVTGEVLEKDRARSLYTDIVRRMQDPGLLEYLGDNLFKASVFPIPPQGEQKIEISYSEVIRPDGGLAEYRFPLKTGTQASRVKDFFSTVIELDSKVPLKTIYSPTHKIEVARKDDHHAKVSFEETGATLDKDFRLLYTLSEKDFGLNLITYRKKDEDGYFLVMIAPRAELKAEEIQPKDVCFVLDTSGSMAGEKIEQAQKALKYCVSRLDPRDRFAIVRFSTDVDLFQPALVAADKANTAAAAQYIEQLTARGGTDINSALLQALDLGRKGGDPKRPYLVVFMTDGRPTIGLVDAKEILTQVGKQNQANVRIFAFGVGNDVNAPLLDQLANDTRAVSQYVEPQEDLEIKVSGFYDKVDAPVLSGLAMDWADTRAFDLYPRQLPDLFKGSQLLVLGRYKTPGHKAVRLTGLLNGKKQDFVYEGDFSEQTVTQDFIPKLWAQRKIGYLLEEIRLKGDVPELVQEVVALSKEHGIVTPYTSYLILEDRPLQTAAVPRPRVMGGAAGGPAGDRDDGVISYHRAMPAAGTAGEAVAATAPARDKDLALGAEKESKLDQLLPFMRRVKKPQSSAVAAASGEAAAEPAPGTPVVSGAAPADRLDLAFDESKELRDAEADKRKQAVRESSQLSAGMKQESGAEAVAASKMLQDLKSGAVAGKGEAKLMGRTRLGSRTFGQYRGIWVDLAWQQDNQPVQVKYLGKAYFALLDRDPALRQVLALGEQVLVVLKSGKAILITTGDEAKDELTTKELDDLFPPGR